MTTTNNNYNIKPIANYHCSTGENPIWDADKQIFYWSDIPTGKIFQYNPKTNQHSQIYSGQQVGGFTIQQDGSLLLFRINDIAIRHEDGSVQSIIDFTDQGMDRFNDVFADPLGRVYAGTMGSKNKAGVYRLNLDGSITPLFKGTNCSNGMAFSPDLKTFYWTDTSSKTIFAFDYDQPTGNLTNQRPFIIVPNDDLNSLPDGMTVDTQGNIYSARWNGYNIVIYNPAGDIIDEIKLPVPKVSSLIFAGPNMTDLYITTAGGNPSPNHPDSDTPDSPDGTLYHTPTSAKGTPEFRSNIKL